MFNKILGRYKCFIFDFDGVIKDTIDVKGDAFVQIFRPTICDELVLRIQEHHKLNGGVSRFEKIRTYLQWLGKDCSEKAVLKFCEKFSKVVQQRVVHSPFVPGIVLFLNSLPHNSKKGIASAIPEKELAGIVTSLDLPKFDFVCGWPKSKTVLIKEAMARFELNHDDILFFGDSVTDLNAAVNTQVDFIFIQSNSVPIQSDYPIFQVKDFNELVDGE